MSAAENKKSKINWETIKTIVITAFIFSTLGVIGGYFLSTNLQSEARQTVVKDITVLQSKAQSR